MLTSDSYPYRKCSTPESGLYYFKLLIKSLWTHRCSYSLVLICFLLFVTGFHLPKYFSQMIELEVFQGISIHPSKLWPIWILSCAVLWILVWAYICGQVFDGWLDQYHSYFTGGFNIDYVFMASKLFLME